MRILVLGGGGREHAIVTRLVESPLVTAVMVAPGNGGTARVAENVSLPIEDGRAVAAFALEHAVDLVVIGPEAPLVAGVADAVRAAGIAAFGPGAEGARLEGSKEFAKALMHRHNIPTGSSRSSPRSSRRSPTSKRLARRSS
jgi:phosphoribosylamine---glycine ligase